MNVMIEKAVQQDPIGGAAPQRSLFFQKITSDQVSETLDKHVAENQLAVILADGYGQLDDISGISRVRRVIDVCKVSPLILDSLNVDDVVIYACVQDDLGLPFIEHLHNIGRKYYPVWSARPGGYAFTNSTARNVLDVEFDFQKRHGFAKWDFGYADFVNLIQALEITRDTPGCYLEVGCYRGSSAGVILRYLATTRRPLETFFLDVFEGFQYGESQTSADAIWYGTHATDGLAAVRERLVGYNTGFSDLKITIEKNNIITDPLPARVIEQGISVANLDVDLHEAVYAGLHKIAPHIVKNGILIVEDPGHTPLLIGARYALEKFLSEDIGKSFIPLSMESGQTFLIKK